jgi:hypothetical protein
MPAAALRQPAARLVLVTQAVVDHGEEEPVNPVAAPACQGLLPALKRCLEPAGAVEDEAERTAIELLPCPGGGAEPERPAAVPMPSLSRTHDASLAEPALIRPEVSVYLWVGSW